MPGVEQCWNMAGGHSSTVTRRLILHQFSRCCWPQGQKSEKAGSAGWKSRRTVPQPTRRGLLKCKNVLEQRREKTPLLRIVKSALLPVDRPPLAFFEEL